tara:strand:- start:119 stop:1087 length:969 start_codon:yes stop_codon:yes gene_type:complete
MAIYLIYPYLYVLLWGFIFTIILHPLYQFIETYYSPRSSATLTIASLFLIFLLPLTILIWSHISNSISYLSDEDGYRQIINQLTHMFENIPKIGHHIALKIQNFDSYQSMKELVSMDAIQNTIPFIQYAGFSIISSLINLFLFIIIIYKCLVHAKYIEQIIKTKVLSGCSRKSQVMELVVHNIQIISFNILISGLITGVVMTIVYYLTATPAPLTLGMITAIIALIPFVLPIFYLLLALFMMFNQLYYAALTILVIGIATNFFTDNILQPKLLRDKTNINYLVSIIGILCGLTVFGPIGIFIGPIILQLIQFLFLKQNSQKP